MKIDPYDPLFTERGIDPDVAEAQGFVLWTPEDYVEVINTAYEPLMETQSGSVQWLRNKANESGTGVIITRHSPIQDKNGHPLVPEIRPDTPVVSGMTKRHYHGEWRDPWEFLPSEVVVAYCRPERGFTKAYRLKFKHVHESLSEEELRLHIRTWHLPDRDDAEPNLPRPDKAHWHSLHVFQSKYMSEHIMQGSDGEGGKRTHEHRGENNGEIHFHTSKAKYLFAPSQKTEVNWNRPHNHDRMAEDELAWHLQVHHSDGSPSE